MFGNVMLCEGYAYFFAELAPYPTPKLPMQLIAMSPLHVFGSLWARSPFLLSCGDEIAGAAIRARSIRAGIYGCHLSSGSDRPTAASRGCVSISAGRGPWIELSGRYSASKLMTALAQPGHHLPLAVTFGFFTLSRSKRQLYGDEVGT